MPQQPTAAQMRAVVDMLAGPHVSERSVKLRPGRLSADRFLVTCQPAVLGPDPRSRFRDIARTLDCEPAAIERLTAGWERVITVHLGCDGIDPPLFKLYVEYEFGRPGPDDVPADTLFLAAKWCPGEPASFSYYRQLLEATKAREVRAALAMQFKPDVGEHSAAFADRVLSELIMTEGRVDVVLVEDEATPRKSFDINLYRVATPLARHRGALASLCDSFGLPDAPPRILADGQGTTLGHVAIGRDAAGSEFVTLYYAMTKHAHG